MIQNTIDRYLNISEGWNLSDPQLIQLILSETGIALLGVWFQNNITEIKTFLKWLNQESAFKQSYKEMLLKEYNKYQSLK